MDAIEDKPDWGPAELDKKKCKKHKKWRRACDMEQDEDGRWQCTLGSECMPSNEEMKDLPPERREHFESLKRKSQQQQEEKDDGKLRRSDSRSKSPG